MNARAYRVRPHDVIELDARRLIEAYHDRIWFCPMNSGCTKPIPHPRDERTFLRIPKYPYSHWRSRRRRGERVVEVAVDYSIPDVRKFVLRASEMQGQRTLRILYEA
jgi:hypothetical protein